MTDDSDFTQSPSFDEQWQFTDTKTTGVRNLLQQIVEL